MPGAQFLSEVREQPAGLLGLLSAVVDAAERAHSAWASLVAGGATATQIAHAGYALPVPEPPLDPDRPAGLSKVAPAR